MPLTLAETPLYYKDSQGQYHRIMSGADMTGYRTAAEQDEIDAAQDVDIDTRAKAEEIAIVITGARPSMVVTAGQYVVVRNSTISGISDGLYIVKSGYSLSPSVDVTASSLSAWNIGGLNGLVLTQSTGTYSPSATFNTNEGNVRTYGKMNIFTILLQVSNGVIPANTYTNIGTITPHPNVRMNTTTQDSYGTMVLVDILTNGIVRVYCYNKPMNGTVRTQLCYLTN